MEIRDHLYAESALHHDVTKKVILCSEDWGKYWAQNYKNVKMAPNETKHGYHYCSHVHVVKYSCHDFVAYLKTWDTAVFGYYGKCPARKKQHGGRAL